MDGSGVAVCRAPIFWLPPEPAQLGSDHSPHLGVAFENLSGSSRGAPPKAWCQVPHRSKSLPQWALPDGLVGH